MAYDQCCVQDAARQTVGVVVEDVINKRLIASAATSLGLTPEVAPAEAFTDAALLCMDLVLADETSAKRIVQRLHSTIAPDDPSRTPVIAVVPAKYNINDDIRKNYDGVLPMPQPPDIVAAQLSLTLYSHRSFALRYEDQMRELHRHCQIFNSIASGVTVVSAKEPDLPIQYVNPAFEALTGYTLEECRGRNCRFLQGEERDQPARALLREALQEGKATVAILHNYRKDGSAFWNELSLAPIRSRSGELTHYVAIQADVTQRVEFERALRESEKLAVAGRLAAVISHEINNPLGSVTNLTYLARRSNNLEEIHRYLDTLDGELRRIKLITSQSLRFARQSSSPTAINASELLHSVLDVQMSRIHVAAGVKLECRLRFEGHFVGLESEIRQVLNNLILNATDSMRSRPGVLHARSRRATDWKSGEHGIMFTVADSGEGMSNQTKANLFKAFFTTKGQNGTGLGLWLSVEIIKRHNGQLRFRSRQGQKSGTVFQLFLPEQACLDTKEQAIPYELTAA